MIDAAMKAFERSREQNVLVLLYERNDSIRFGKN